MSDTPETLPLAELLETGGWPDAAAELTRLHEAHDWQYKMAGDRLRRVEKLEAEVEALRAAAQTFVQDYENGDMGDLKHYARAMRAALAKEKAS